MALTIPRFGSTRASDPDYDPVLARIIDRVLIRVDGKSVFSPVAYNIDEGWVRALAYKRHRTGPITMAMRKGVVLEETLVGRVAARWR
jgi:hypothetical protein